MKNNQDDTLLDYIADIVIDIVEIIKDKPDLENLSSLHSSWEVLDKEKLKEKIDLILYQLDQRYNKDKYE